VGEHSQILPDPVAECRRLMALAAADGIVMRAIGGVAFVLQCEVDGPPLQRPLKDVDVVIPRGASRTAVATIERAGYVPDEMFNVLRGTSRLLFYDVDNHRHLDVFVGSFVLCHELPIAERLERDSLTIPREELLLSKLQIVALTDNDLVDIFNLLSVHEVVESSDAGGIDAQFIAGLCAQDWGLWRTTQQSLQRVNETLERSALDTSQQARVRDGLRVLAEHIEKTPKSGKWRMRSRIGDRVKWYNEPSEDDER